MDDREAFLILNAVPGIGNSSARKLLDRYGSASKVLSLTEHDLSVDPVVSPKIIENILHFPKDKFLQSEYNLMGRKGVRAVTWLDEDYPAPLRQIADAPIALYIKGHLPPDPFLSLAMVGSRRASFYGIATSEKFAVRLAELGFTVVSGMARGIDTAAHQGTLKAGGTTIAVLGCGLAHIYPPENHQLMEAIAKTGAAISEFPMTKLPLPYNFPRRNRIISGLSLGVIVVEAAQKSGALITADFALEQGRDVFAVPGKIDHPSSYGTHGLIKQGAKLVTCVEDILEDIQPRVLAHLNEQGHSSEVQNPRIPEREFGASRKKNLEGPQRELSDEERKVFDHITDRPVHIDELTSCCGQTVPVMAVLLRLELKHLVKQLPGKLFVR